MSPATDSVTSAGTESVSLADRLKKVRAAVSEGNLAAAEPLARRLLIQFPEDDRVRLVAAETFAAIDDHDAAIELLKMIGLSTAEGRAAADLHYRLLVSAGERSVAADVLLQAIDQHSRVDVWKHVAWQLLNQLGRRHEASEIAEQLCRQGDATRDQRLSLLRRGGAFPMQLTEDEKPEQHFLPGYAMARWYFSQEDYRAALAELESQTQTRTLTSAEEAFRGRLLAETQHFDKLRRWLANDSNALTPHADYWIALGSYLLDQHDYRSAVGALLEAVFRDPTDDLATHRLATAFRGLDRVSDAEQFHYRGVLIAQSYQKGELLLDSQDDNRSAEKELAAILLQLGRPFESLAWKIASLPASANQARRILHHQRQQLLGRPDVLQMPNEMALIDIDRADFPTARARKKLAKHSHRSKRRRPREAKITANPRLRNVVAEVGVDFRWYLDDPIDLKTIALYEAFGGGLASIDYDLDGWPDLYLAQGSGKPPAASSTRSNKMFRNVGASFVDTTSQSQTEDFHYSTGIAAGDINQDGFPDLLLAAIGKNRLLINNGDGTFRDATDHLGASSVRFTSSVAIADIDGDHLPDLYETVYVEMAGALKEPERDAEGEWMIPTPLDFYAENDRWFRSQGNGRFQAEPVEMPAVDRGTGLGVVITNFDQDENNEVFVANDARPNHLLEFESNQLANVADAFGLANGFAGAANACMGIATGDFDRNGRIDLHITNFFDESANLYLQTRRGGFVDRARAFHLDTASRPHVGFGTKAIDLDRNGWLDLIVTNGHVFDRRRQGESFALPPQVLMNRGNRFESIDVQDPSGYWEGEYLGRALMATDFNRDHRVDFVIGHLDQPVAILSNETEADGNWIQLQLVGTASERDAIGAKITVTAADQRWRDWVVAGDGYLANDEPVTTIAIGTAEAIDTLEVVWPNGARQVFTSPQPNRRYLIVEGQPSLTDMTRPVETLSSSQPSAE